MVGRPDSKTLSKRKKLRTERSIGYCGKKSILEEFDKNKSGGSVPTESLVEPNEAFVLSDPGEPVPWRNEFLRSIRYLPTDLSFCLLLQPLSEALEQHVS